jgi:hypothetical protein
MSIYKEWVDFVSFPLDPEKCYTRVQRLDITNAVSVNSENYTPELGTEKGVIVTKDHIFFDDDEFEEMLISDYGQVIVWTKKRVWTLQDQGHREKLVFLPRHPQFLYPE